MIPSLELIIALATLAGVMLSWTLGSIIIQPDWGIAILFAALITRPGRWQWILPATIMHDLILFWNPLVFTPLLALLSWILIKVDQELEPAIPQRIVFLLIATLPAFWVLYDWKIWILTTLAILPCWYICAISDERTT